MNKQPSVSLVIPAYNEESAIETCLESALAQTVAFEEIIIVDNNSTDKTVDIVKKYVKKHPTTVKLISEAKQGVTYSRDTGFNAVKSDVIGRIDADCILDDDWAEQVQHTFCDPDIAASTGSVYGHDMPVRSTGQRIDSVIRNLTDKLSVKSKFLYGSNMAIRRSAWESVRDEVCHDDDYHEDLDLAIHLTQNDLTIFFDKNMIVGISLRRMESSPNEFRKYMSLYSATYRGHDIREASITIPIAILWSTYPSLKLIRGAYDADTKKISLEKLFVKSGATRVGPNG